MGKSLTNPYVKHPRALLALGANLPSALGFPRQALIAALTALASDAEMTLTAVSRFFVSPAYPAGSGPDYVNAAAEIATPLPPEALLARLHGIEATLGRVRDAASGRWGPRVIDIDLLAKETQVLPDGATQDAWRALPDAVQRVQVPDRLILPHPRLQDRAFVLRPLADIAPGWRHPRLGADVAQMLADLPPAATDGLHPIGRENA
ncbi:2-amino-4-hydroxy-6-hydroxymethyldihydropteridine diphosphokinase [Paracoccus suum]|uniref:2-amino-4-hydroxy-6-hydroxymethyldihydropteridine pyrophosphokinase n=1 Tax=Paracoccus suum TaxID=2259340 RepID=A0A344PJ86_9RHOB|nr:2-amino-4-hydroxy-6-hydroxymethyldihydropteridine diphosphokinase [Paracoccus suum]AXC49441.1 2-amino-4-hydroxy-6-hydroxymethyldihydropteridine diphosphokinase [Paracoccus suum]